MDERIREAMKTQLAERQARIDAGDERLGWKVGFGSRVYKRILRIDGALIGYLLKAGQFASPAKQAFADFTKAVAEPEIAVYMGSDLPAGADEATTRAAISALGPAIEIADATFPGKDAVAILEANIYQVGVVLGDADPSLAGAPVEGLAASVSVNGEAVKCPEDIEKNTGKVIDTVRHVADVLAEFGEELQAGDVIIAGSIIPPLFLDEPSLVEFTLGDAAPISVSFE